MKVCHIEMTSQRHNMNFSDEESSMESHSQSNGYCDDGDHEKLEESSLRKSFYFRSVLGFGEATQFLQNMNFLSIKESSTRGSATDLLNVSSPPSYLCFDKSTTPVLQLYSSNEGILGNVNQFSIEDMKRNVISRFPLTDRLKTDKKILVKSPTKKYIGCINFINGGNTSLDLFQIQDSSSQIVMSMRPVHISLQQFEFPIVYQNNGIVANIFYEGNATVLIVAESLPPDLKLLLLPLMILLMKIKLKKKRKQ